MKRRTRAVSAALLVSSLAVSSLLVSGCGSTNAGTAATVGSETISEAQLTDWTQGVLVATGKSPNAIEEGSKRRYRPSGYALTDPSAPM